MEKDEREQLALPKRALVRIESLNTTVQIFLFAAVVTILSVIHYVSTLLSWTHVGFTLDDSWIHVQYARTIYEGRPWEYAPGIPSTGSTSPLWSIILSSVFILTQDPTGIVWGTIIISTVLYVGSSFLIGILVYKYTENVAWAFPAILGFVIVPRSTWLMLSGMEFPIFMFTILLSFMVLERAGWKNDILLGVVGGLVYLSRPEGFFVVGIVFPFRLLKVCKQGELDRRRVLSIIGMGAAALLVVTPWVLHCLNVTGMPLPDTFYVKIGSPSQSDILTWYTWWRVFLVIFPFIPVGLSLGVYLLLGARSSSSAIWLFVVVLIITYGLTTPFYALINNFRYLVPIFDLLQLLSVVGIGIIIERNLKDITIPREKQRYQLEGVIILLILLIPLVPGYIEQANFYGNAVKNINEQQVVIGKWINENISEGEIIAIADAGALAFFGDRTTIDLVGLTTPDMVHLNLTSRERLIYIRDLGCNYIVTFNQWFWIWGTQLKQGWTILFSVVLVDNVISGADKKSVYYINWSLTDLAP